MDPDLFYKWNNRANKNAPSPINKVQMMQKNLHSTGEGSPRSRLADAAESAAGGFFDYKSPVAEAMYRKRFPQGVINDTTGEARASVADNKVFVPNTPPSKIEKQFGYYGVANHESEHAYNQDRKDPIIKKYVELAPTTGDLVFLGQQFQNETGKPLDHRVHLPGSSHDIKWMQDQAAKHGYFDGRSMQDMLFNTPEGRQWVRKSAAPISIPKTGTDYPRYMDTQTQQAEYPYPGDSRISRTAADGSPIQPPPDIARASQLTSNPIARNNEEAYSNHSYPKSRMPDRQVGPPASSATARNQYGLPSEDQTIENYEGQIVSRNTRSDPAIQPPPDIARASQLTSNPIARNNEEPPMQNYYPQYDWKTRQPIRGSIVPRKPSGASVAQPIGNSGQPNTAGLQEPPKPPNAQGVQKPKQFDATTAYGRWNSAYDSRPQATTLLPGAIGPTLPGQEAESRERMAEFMKMSPGDQAQFNTQVEADKGSAAKAAEESRRNLEFTGASTGNEYADSLNKRSDHYASRRESADAMNAHQNAGGGLKYRQSSTGFGMPEQVSQSTGEFRAMADQEKSKWDAYNKSQDAAMDKHQQDSRQHWSDLGQKLGLEDTRQAKESIDKITGEYQAIAKSGKAKGLKFIDFIQNKIDTGRLMLDGDTVKVISNSYGHEFKGTEGNDQRTASYSDQWGDPLWEAQVANEIRRRANRERIEGSRQARHEQAKAESEARRKEVSLISKGMSPLQAKYAVAAETQRQKALDAYNDAAGADERLGMAKIAQSERESDRAYKSREFDMAQGKDKADKAFMAESHAKAVELYPNDSYKQKMYMDTQMAYKEGRTPVDHVSASRQAGNNRDEGQSNLIVEEQAQKNASLQETNEPTSIATLNTRLSDAGLSDKEKIMTIEKVFGHAGLDTPSGAAAMVSKIYDQIIEKAENAGTNSKSNGAETYNATYNNEMKTYQGVLDLLKKNVPEQVMKDIHDKLRKRAVEGRWSSTPLTGKITGTSKSLGLMDMMYGSSGKAPPTTPPGGATTGTSAFSLFYGN
jgi:hypothetical protein